eukprot:EG_transcript_5354
MFLSSNRTNNRLIPEQQSPGSIKPCVIHHVAPATPKHTRNPAPENRSNPSTLDHGSDSDEDAGGVQAQSRPSSAHLRASRRMLPGTFSPAPAPLSPGVRCPALLQSPTSGDAADSPVSTDFSSTDRSGDAPANLQRPQTQENHATPHADYEDDFEESLEVEVEEERVSPAPAEEQWATSVRVAPDPLADSMSPPPWGMSASEPPWGDDPPWTANDEEEGAVPEQPCWIDESPKKNHILDLGLPGPRQRKANDNLHLTSMSSLMTVKQPKKTSAAAAAVTSEAQSSRPHVLQPADSPAHRAFYEEATTHNWLLKFDDIEVNESLGSGGFGTVYRGRLKYSGDVIAVKICLCQDNDMVAAFKREVKMLSSLRHEHIVLFRGACIDIPHMCIVTELMCRGNLYNILHDEDMDMSWKLRVRWARDIARGMNYLHTLSPPVVHRDLKSPNVLVNDYYMIKLCDFGMSRTKQHTMIQTKQMGGSPLWMAPECLRGEPFSEKSDVYSFGVLLWEVMTREVPWEDKEVVQLVGLVGFKNQTLPVPPLSHHPGCPEAYVAIMQECWSPSPSDRPSFRHTMPMFEEMAIHAL